MADDAVSGGGIPAAALEAVREFLRYAVDERDPEKARAFLSAASLAGAMDDIPEEWRGGTYAIGGGMIEGDQVWVIVEMANGDQKVNVPFAPVQEQGAWKLDLGKTMEKLMGGMMADAVGQMASAVGEMMAGVGEVLGEVKDAVETAIVEAMDEEAEEEAREGAPQRKKIAKSPVKKAAPVKRRAAAKKTVVKKAVTKKPVKTAKAATKKAAKKAKPMKKNKPAKKAKPAKKTKKRK